MKLIVVSHACSTPQNQLFFERIRDISGWQVVIIAPSDWTSEYRKRTKTVKLAGFQGILKTVPVYVSGKVPLHFYHPNLFKVMTVERPDAIYMHNESYALSTFQVFVSNLLILRKPIAFYSAQNITKKYPFPFRIIENFVFKNASLAFPVTYSAKICLEQKGYTGQSVVLPLGINDQYLTDLDGFKITNEDISIIGYVGRLVPEKGLKDLILALARIKDQGWICHIIGEGPEKEELIKLSIVEGLADRIKFVGYVGHGDVFSKIQEMSVLVLPARTQPNWKEQFGRVIIEALAAGVPVVGTDCGEIPHLINSLEGGCVVREGDIEQIADTLKELINNPVQRASLGSKGRENVRKQFLETKIASDFVDAFLKPLSGTNRS